MALDGRWRGRVALVNIRPYVPDDRPAVEELRKAAGEEFWFNDPDSPINVTSLVVEDEGRIVAILTGRLVVEGFLTLDKSYGTPMAKWRMLKRLFREGCLELKRRGLMEAFAAIPRQLESYTGLLEKLPFFKRDNRTRFLIPLWRLTE